MVALAIFLQMECLDTRYNGKARGYVADSHHGVITVAFGPNARTEAAAMIASLKQHHDWPVLAIADGDVLAQGPEQLEMF